MNMKHYRLAMFALLAWLAVADGLAGRKGSWVQLRPNTFVLVDRPSSGGGFSLTATLDLPTSVGDSVVLSIPDLLSVRLRQHNPADHRRQNYSAFPMADGSVPVLEASLLLRLPDESTPVREGQPQVQEMVIGVPLARLDKPCGRHEVVLNYTGVTWDMYVDRQLVDRDFALGTPAVEALPALGANAGLLPPAWQAEGPKEAIPVAGGKGADSPLVPVQYFTPRGHNAWVGDVATIWHQGRYHVFYLLDRRGHESKFGRGGHYFEHLSTADFRHWTEHEPATSIEEQWETFGTGTPFVWRDSLFLSYGMHTSRIYPSELTATPRQWEYIRRHGKSEAIPFAHPFTAGREYPSGASYSVSQDGVAHFERSRILIHPAENPTIYTDADGRLCMLANYGARGMWTSPQLDGGWQCLSEDFPPGGDCTFIFAWGDFEYIVGGFTGQWMKRRDEPIEAYRDLVAEGRDLYDGLSVPSICEIADGRRLMAGWVETNRHWGGPLVVRELIQHPDGTIGSRFMPELMPAPKGKKRRGEKARQLEAGKNYLVTFDAKPSAGGILRLNLADDEGGTTCQWTLDTREKTARFGDGKSLRNGGEPHRAVDYAIEHIAGLEQSFPVRIVLRGEPKFGGTFVDIEIAGQRTMISHRSRLKVSSIDIQAEGLAVENLTTQEVF